MTKLIEALQEYLIQEESNKTAVIQRLELLEQKISELTAGNIKEIIDQPEIGYKRIFELDPLKVRNDFDVLPRDLRTSVGLYAVDDPFNRIYFDLYTMQWIDKKLCHERRTLKGLVGGQASLTAMQTTDEWLGGGTWYRSLAHKKHYNIGFTIELSDSYFQAAESLKSGDWINLWQIKNRVSEGYPTGLLIALFSKPSIPDLHFRIEQIKDRAGENTRTIPRAENNKYKVLVKMYLDNDTNGYYKINVNGLDIYEVNGVSNWAGALDGGLRGAVRGPYIGIYSNNEEGFPVTFKVAYSNIFIDAK